jgi:hypothetical protein
MSDLDLALQAFNKAKVQGDVANAKRFAQIALDLDTGFAPPAPAYTPPPVDPTQPLPDADSGFFRQALDVPTQLAKGAVTGTRFLTDVFGADNPVSQTLSGIEDDLDSLLSAQSKRDQQEVARIMQQAEDKGVADQIKAGLQALSVAPVDLISNAFGTSAPVILGGLLGTVVGAPAAATATGLGVLTGVGITKDAAYDAVLQELVGSGVPEDQAKEAAKEAQAYSGENLDNIAFGGFLGGLASRFGLEKSIFSGMVRRKLAKEAPEEVIEEALDSAPRALLDASERSTLGEVSRAAVTEAIPEALQGGQEQFTRNVALQREGFDVPTGRGVVTAGTLEGAVGAPVGAIAEGAQRFKLLGDQQAKIDYLNELADNINSVPLPPEGTAEASKNANEDIVIVGEDELSDADIEAAMAVWADKENLELVEKLNTLTPEEQAEELAAQGKTKEEFDEVVSTLRTARNTIDRAKRQNLSEFEIKQLMKKPGAPPAPEAGFADIQKTNNETPLSRSFLGRISALRKNNAAKNLTGAPKKAVSYFLKGTKTANPNEGLFTLAYETATSQATTNADIDARRTEQPNIPASEQIQKAAGAPLRTDKQQEEVDAAATYLRDIADPKTLARFDNLVDSIKQRHQDGIIEQARSIRVAETEAGVETETDVGTENINPIPDPQGVVAASQASAEELATADMSKLLEAANEYNDRVAEEVITKLLGPKAAAEYAKLPSGSERQLNWLAENSTDVFELDVEVDKRFVNTDRLEAFSRYVGVYSEESPTEMGKSIGRLFQKMGSPDFKSTPEYAGILSAFNYATEKGWNVEEVLAGAKIGAQEYAGTNFQELFPELFGVSIPKVAPASAIETDELAADTEADEAATGKRNPKPRTRVLSPVSIFNVPDSATTSAPDPKVQAVENVKAEMGVTRLPRKGTKKRAEYDSKVQAETQRLAKQAETDFENITSEDIAAQIEAQGITAPEAETKYKGADINPDVVVIAESGNLNRTIERLLETLPKELRPIVRQMRRMASATKIEIAPVEGPRPGKYDSGTNTITLDPDGGLTTGVFFHELSHAALARRLNDPNSAEAKAFFDFFSQIKDQMGDSYGGTDLDEFTSELVNNSEFQNLLKDIKAPKSKTLWQAIMDAIASFFGIRKGQNAYEAGIEFIDGILSLDPSNEPPPLAKVFYANESPDVAAKETMESLSDFTPSKAQKIIDKLLDAPALLTAAMGSLRLDNLMQMYNKFLPAIKEIITNVELRQGYQEQRIEEANKKYNAMMAVLAKFKTQMRAMATMAIEARLARVDILDPNFEKNNKLKPKQVAELERLKGIYDKLPEAVQNVYKIMRNDFDAMYVEYKTEILNEIQNLDLRAQVAKKFDEEPPIAGYVPFRRYGEFVLNYIDPNTKKWTSRAFETKRERDMEIQALGLTLRSDLQNAVDQDISEDGSDAKEAQGKLQAGEYTFLNSIKRATQKTMPAQGFVADLMAVLEQDGKAKGLTDAQIKSQVDTVYSTYLDMFPESSIAKSFIKAKDIPGASEDLVRAYGDTMVKWARKMADVKYNGKIQSAFNKVEKQGRSSDRVDVRAAAQSIVDREERTLNPTFGDAARMSTTGSYLMFMTGNISSGLVNISSLPLLAFPILSGKYGGPKAMAAMTRASRTGVLDIMKTEGVPRWATAGYKGGKYKLLFETLRDHGQLRHTQVREILEGARESTAEYSGYTAKILNFLSAPIERTERYNRTVTSIAAFDLALEGGMTPEAAAEYAMRVVKDVNTSGMSSTAPKWMQGDIGRVMFTFKGFIWNSAYVTAQAFVDSIKGAPDRTRREAFRQLAYTFGMSYAIAGAFGLPFFGAISVLTNMVNSLLDDEEEPFNLRREMMLIMPESVTKGPLNYYTNLEISNRASVANGMLFREDPYEIEKYGYLQSMALQAFGPLGNYILDAPYKLGLIADGEYQRGFEGLAPSWLRNGAKAMRFAREGATTIDGRPIDTDISAWNLANQALGFSPANVSSLYETRALAKQYEGQVLRTRSNLLKRRYLALTTGDSDLFEETEMKIYEFMSRYPQLMTMDTLKRSFKSRAAQEQEYVSGIRFNKSFFQNLTPLFDRLEDVDYYGAL